MKIIIRLLKNNGHIYKSTNRIKINFSKFKFKLRKKLNEKIARYYF